MQPAVAVVTARALAASTSRRVLSLELLELWRLSDNML
jgi:hypothetical protein